MRTEFGFYIVKIIFRFMIPKSFRSFLRAIVSRVVSLLKGMKLLIYWRLSPTKTIDVCRYYNLIGARELLADIEYKQMTQYMFLNNIERIREKKIIKIWFMFLWDSVWSCDDIYRLFENSGKFEPTVVLTDIFDETVNEKARTLVQRNKYRYISSKELRTCCAEPPDIVMYPSLYDQYGKGFNICDRKLSSLVLCIPYTFWWDTLTGISMLGSKNSAVLWRFYAPTKIHMRMGIQRNIIGNQNMRYSGYPKLDTFVNHGNVDCTNRKKTVIYAPGTCSSDETTDFSTFEFNAFDILEMAKATAGIINWIYRPHPILGINLAQYGVMPLSDYQAYEAEWSKVANVQMSIGGPYQDIFLSSDAMITDAVSFVSSYQYVKKPLLFIDRHRGEGLNEFGQKLHEVIYHADANDIEKIQWFINEVVVGGNDELKEKREEFFREYLDYYSENHCTASEYIYKDICKAIFGEEQMEESK